MSDVSTPKPPRNLKRKVWRTFLVLLTIAVVMRVIVFFAIPPVMRKVAAAYGFDVAFQRQELTLLGGDVGLWDLKITPKTGGEPMFQADYIRGYISTFELLKGRLLVRRAEADGVDLVIERTAAGKIPLLEHILAVTNSTQPAVVATPVAQKPLDFTPPLQVEAFRLQHVRAHLRDGAVTPPLEATVAMDMRVTGLGSQVRPTQFDIDLWSDQILDSLRISGQATVVARSINLSAGVSMRGLHPGALASYLAPLGLRSAGNSIGADLAATVKTEAASNSHPGIKATITLDKIRVTSNGQDAAALTKLQIEADDVLPQSASIGLIALDGGRIFASRNEKGLLQVFGLEFAGAAPTTAPAPTPVVASPSAAPFKLMVKQIAINDAVASFRDFSIIPTNEIKATVAKLTVQGDSINPLDPQAVIPIDGQMSIPGIAQTITLKGSVAPFAQTKTLQGRFDAAGIKPDVLKPYLAAIGVDSLLDNASATGQLDATLQLSRATGPVVSANVTALKLTDGAELIGMESAKIVGASLDGQTGRIKIQSVDLSGPSVDITRDSASRLTVAKFRWNPAILSSRSAAPSTAPATSPSATQFNLAALPKLEIGSLTWKGLRARLRDEQTQPPSTIAIDDAGIELKDFVFDLTTADPGKPGSIRAWLVSPELAKQAGIEGTLQSGQNAFSADIKARGQGIQTTILAPYLKAIGIEPTLRDGSLQADVKLNLAQTGDGVTSSLNLTAVSMKDGSTELGGVDTLQLEGFTIGKSGIDIKSLQISRPHAGVALDPDNTLAALGIRAKLPQSAKQAPTTAPSPLVLPVIAIHTLRVTDGQLDWTDRGFASPVQTSGRATLELTELKIGSPGAAAARFRTVLSASDVMDEIIIEGAANPDPDALTLQATINGRGIRAGSLAAYLPSGVEFSTRDGRIRATIDAALTKNPQGGSNARLSIDNVDWRDGESATSPLFAMQNLRVAASRVDLPDNVIAVDEVSVSGVEAAIDLAADGSVHAFGIRAGGKPSNAENRSVRETQPGPSTVPVEDVASLIAAARKPLPLMTLKTLDINLRRASVRDLSRPASAPLVAENLRIHNTAPIELGGQGADSRPPVKIDISGTLSPLVDRFTLSTTATPFAPEPAASIDLSATGIRGEGLTSLVPEIKKYIDGMKLTDGRLQTKVQTHIKFDRKGPRDFDLSRRFQLDLSIDGTTFRDGADGPVLAGLESLRLEQAKVEPKMLSISAKSLEITKPSANIYRETDGIHAFGYVIPIDQYLKPSTAPSTAPSETQATVAVATPPTTRPSNEIRIDRLLITGLDLKYEDRAVTPHFVAPLNQLDVEVRDLTTLALYEPRTIRFAAIINADKVPLPAANIPKGATSRPSENRDFFSQMSATGRISLYPRPGGYAKASVNGMELAAFEGLVSQFGAQVHGGVFDGTFDLRFRDNGDLDTRSKLVITDLQYAESPNGPLQNAFASPADLIIKAVEAPDNSITIPLNVELKNNQLSNGQIAGAALGAASSVVVTAVASAPVKVTETAAQFVGLGGIFGKKDAPPAPAAIDFSPGSTYIDPAARQRLDAVLEFARKNKNSQIKITCELTNADVDVAASRANPELDDAKLMAGQLRSRKLALSQQRSQLAGELRAQLVFLNASQRNTAVDQLRDMDAQIGDTERSLDFIYDLQRPGAQLQSGRRTRAAALEIVKQRLNGAQSLLQSTRIFSDFAAKVQTESAKYQPTESTSGGRIIFSIVGKAP